MSGYIGNQPVPQATQTRDSFTATANQTSFPTSGYTPEFLDVFLNGVKLASTDYTATNGSDVVLASGAAASDILEVVAYGTFEVLNPTFDGNVTFTGNASFGDNDKAIFGAGSDLKIYHDGSNSYIDEVGTGDLFIKAGNDLRLQTPDGEAGLTVNQNSSVQIYYDNIEKLATTSTGIAVTGKAVLTSGELTFSGSISDPNGAAYIWRPADNTLAFGTANEERMRIDSSGNLLVGTTSVNPHGNSSGTTADNGTSLDASGYLSAGRYQGPSGYFNRTGTDGEIVQFRKDGSSVGGIGVAQSGDRTYFSGGSYGIASDTSETTIMPCGTTGTGNDGVLNLGKSDARFKDAYLSGGIYLGGTGSANKLDDYEEGDWTPSPISGSGFTIAADRGSTYTKIGRMVHLTANLSLGYSGSNGGAQVEITGLPFTPKSGNAGRANAQPWVDWVNTGVAGSIQAGIWAGSNRIRHYVTRTDSNSNQLSLTADDLNASSNTEYQLNITYLTE